MAISLAKKVDLKDTFDRWRIKCNAIFDSFGDIENILTTNKNDLVSAINELFSSKAPLSSPTFTNIPTVPTAAPGTDTLQIANTEFVNDAVFNSAFTVEQIITAVKVGDGSGSGVDADLLDGQHGAFYAPISNPNFSGNASGLGIASGTSFNAITGLSSTTPLVAGTPAIGSATTAARANHVHPLQTSVSGSASTLATPRTINGVNFDGSSNIVIGAVDPTARIASSEKGVVNGVATLDEYGSIDRYQLPGMMIGRNRFVNGAYQVSQINGDVVHTITAGAAINYGVDCWYTQCTGSNALVQRVSGNYPFKYKYVIGNDGTGSTPTSLHGTRIEGKNCVDLVDQEVAVQVRIHAPANIVTWKVYYANVEDNFSAKTQIATGTLDVSAGEHTHNFTFNAGPNAWKGLCIEYSTGAIPSGLWVIYSGHQLEKISPWITIGTDYEHVDYDIMLRRCQRYYEKNNRLDMRNAAASTQATYVNWKFSVTKRAVPTLTLSGGGQTASSMDINGAVIRQDVATLVIVVVAENTVVATSFL